MASISDRWMRPGAEGRKVRSDRYGTGLRWLVEWVEPGAKKRRKSFVNKDAALAYKAKMEVELNEDRYVSPRRQAVTYADVWPLFERMKSNRSRKTRESYELVWRGYIRDHWGHRNVKDTTRVQVQGWLAGLTLQGGRSISVSLERKIVIVMKALAQIAVEEKMMHGPSPLAKVRARDPLPSGKRYLTVAEIDALLDALGDHALVAEVLLMTGIRKGEAFGLQVRDLDVRRKRLRIERNLDDEGMEDATKSGRHRDVPVRGDLLKALRARADGCRRTDWLLPAPGGGGWNRDKWRRVWERARTTAGLEDLDTHELRHTAVSLAIQAGANVKAVQRMVGHADASVTLNTYSHLWDDELDTVAERMADLLHSERSRISSERAGSPQTPPSD